MTDEELKKAAEEYAYRGMPDEMKPYVKPVGDEVIKNFIAGAEWQENKDQETIKTAEDHAFLAGADWQMEQMLKDAVEGVVMDFSSNQPRPQVDVYVDPHKYHTGDKVRVIILKEDEK